MANFGMVDWSSFVNELVQGHLQTQELDNQLDGPCSTEVCKAMVQGILGTWERLLTMAKPIDSDAEHHSPSDSPRSGTPKREFKCEEQRQMLKKRKTLKSWSTQVHVPAGGGLEGVGNDGYSWRKYGQKAILGAKYPRGYYRCTHRLTKGCPATKLVQRSDENNAVFEVTYKGAHTCNPRRQSLPPSAPPPAPLQQQHDQYNGNHDGDLLEIFKTGLTVKTEGLDDCHYYHDELAASPSPFFFPTTPVNGGLVGSSSSFSPFISPVNSESNFFDMPYFGSSRHGSDSDLVEMLSAATSGANSPVVGSAAGFALDDAEEFEQHLSSFFLQ